MTVSVGVNHDYQPDSVTALPGDAISGDTFFSGPKAYNMGDEHPEWLLTVNDTEPYFFYCSNPGGCINQHMVGVINPNESFTLDAQKNALQDVKFQLSPGEAFPPEATPSLSNSSSSSAPDNSNNPDSSGASLSGGAIAGISIGGVTVIIIAIALVWSCGRKGGVEKGYRKSSRTYQYVPMMEANYGSQPENPPQAPRAGYASRDIHGRLRHHRKHHPHHRWN
ncbi:hypothetical protein TruAng_011723 [Truncatella angustata]|nr:hypothetical protein TruAng_011723 [Truncatella angustata]